MVYILDPTPFNISISQMLNKPITHLIIKGGDSNRASIIQNTSDDMNSNVMTNGFLQLYNLTFNDKLNVNDGSVFYLNQVNFHNNIQVLQFLHFFEHQYNQMKHLVKAL